MRRLCFWCKLQKKERNIVFATGAVGVFFLRKERYCFNNWESEEGTSAGCGRRGMVKERVREWENGREDVARGRRESSVVLLLLVKKTEKMAYGEKLAYCVLAGMPPPSQSNTLARALAERTVSHAEEWEQTTVMKQITNGARWQCCCWSDRSWPLAKVLSTTKQWDDNDVACKESHFLNLLGLSPSFAQKAWLLKAISFRDGDNVDSHRRSATRVVHCITQSLRSHMILFLYKTKIIYRLISDKIVKIKRFKNKKA